MVPPPDKSPSFTSVQPGSTTPTGTKKPSSYSNLRYSPPKRGGTYVVNQKVQSRTQILSISRSTTAALGAASAIGVLPPGSPKRRNESTINHTKTKILSNLATPDNFDLGSSSDSSKSLKHDVITSQPITNSKPQSILSSMNNANNVNINVVNRSTKLNSKVVQQEEEISVNTPLLKKDTEVLIDDHGEGMFQKNNSNVRIISSNSNAAAASFYGNGKRISDYNKDNDNSNKENSNSCCDVLFNCFECMFVIL
jgi:hypothetical protein